MGVIIAYGIVNFIALIAIIAICWDGAVTMTIYPTLNDFLHRKFKANRVIQFIIDLIITIIFMPAMIIYSISAFIFAVGLIIYLLVIKGVTL